MRARAGGAISKSAFDCGHCGNNDQSVRTRCRYRRHALIFYNGTLAIYTPYRRPALSQDLHSSSSSSTSSSSSSSSSKKRGFPASSSNLAHGVEHEHDDGDSGRHHTAARYSLHFKVHCNTWFAVKCTDIIDLSTIDLSLCAYCLEFRVVWCHVASNALPDSARSPTWRHLPSARPRSRSSGKPRRCRCGWPRSIAPRRFARGYVFSACRV